MLEVVNIVVWLLLADVILTFVRKVKKFCVNKPAAYAVRTGGTLREVKENKT